MGLFYRFLLMGSLSIFCCELVLAATEARFSGGINSDEIVLVGAGDISVCHKGGEETAKILDVVSGSVFTLGDNAYPDGTLSQFEKCYGETWGRHIGRTYPSVGNHDYRTLGAAGYFSYFGDTASPLEKNCKKNCKGYYSYNLGAWHIIVLNSEIAHESDSEQIKWLRSDLELNRVECTLAYWHKPRFSSGVHGNNAGVQAFWQTLYDFGVDLVLNGHDHDYERFGLQDPIGKKDNAKGIRQFVVGTGGKTLTSFSKVQPNSEVRNNSTWGVLKLILNAASYEWEFIPVESGKFRDKGEGHCI